MNITKNTECVVVSYKGMQNAKCEDLILFDNMINKTTKFNNKEVLCYRFENPINNYRNVSVSKVMGFPVLGNAVLIGINSTDILSNRPTSWSELKLPKVIALDEVSKENKRIEMDLKNMQRLEHYARRRQPSEIQLQNDYETDDELEGEDFIRRHKGG